MGKELDARVATEIMGWTKTEDGWLNADGHYPVRGVPRYSTFVGTTWAIIEKLKVTHAVILAIYEDGRARVETSKARLSFDPRNEVTRAKTVSEAICLAALKALAPRAMVSVPNQECDALC